MTNDENRYRQNLQTVYDALSEDYDMEGDFGGVDAFGEWMKDSKNRQSVHQEFAKKAGEDYDYDTFSEKLGYGRTSGQGTVAGGVNAATGMPNNTGAMAQGGNMQQMNQQRREAMVRNAAGGAQPNTAVQAGQARTFGPSYEQFKQGFGEYQKRPKAGARGNALGTVAVGAQPEAERTEQGQNEPQNYVEQASQRPQSYYEQAMQPERPAYMTNDEAWEKEQQRQQQSNEQAAYNNEFEAFYQQSAKPVLDAMNEEQKLKWQRNYHERVKQGDPNAYRSYEYQDVAPDVAVKKVSEAVADKMTDFVLMRMGVDPTAANATGTVAESRPMSQEEVAAFDQMYGEEYERLASALQQKIYDEYVKKGMPRNTIEYVVGSMFHNSLLGTVRDIMLSKLDRSEAIRNQLLNQGLAEYRPNTAEAAAAGAASMMVDAPAFMAGGIFGNLLTKGVAKIGGQLLSKNVMKGLAMVNNNFFSWGGYGAASNYLNGKGQVKENIYKGAQAGDENYFNNAFKDASLKTALAEGAKEGVKGVAIGAMGAGVQYATRNAGRTARIATDIGMVPLEAGAFVTMDMMGAEQPMTAEEIMRDYGQQVMMIGLLHGKGVLMSGEKQYTKDHYDEKGRLVEGAYTADGRVKRELALDMFSDEDLAMLKKGRYGSMFEKAKTAKDMMAIVDEVRVGDYGYDRVMWEGIVEDEAYPYMLRAKMAAAHGKTIAMPRPTQSQIIDESAKGEGYWLTTYDSKGKAVESKHFKTLSEAKKAEKMIAGQLEDQSVMELQDVASCADYTTNEVLEQLVNGDPVRGQRLTEAMERMKAGTANDGDMETIAIVRGIVEDAKKNRRETVLSGAAAEVYESVGIDPREALKKLPDNRTEEDKAAINIYKEKIGEHMAQETMSPEEFAVYMDTDSESGTVKTGVTDDGRTVIVKGSGDALRTKDVETGEVKMVDAREVKIVSEMTPAEALEERRRMDAEVEGAAPEAQRTEPGTETEGEQPSTAVQGEELEPGALAEAGRKVSFYPTDADVDADAVEATYLGPDYANPGKHKVQGADGKVHRVYAEDIVMPKEANAEGAAPEAQRTEQQGMVAEGAQHEAERTGQTQLMMDAQGLPTMQNDPKDVAAHYMSGNGGMSAEESREVVDYMIKDKLDKWQKLQGKKPAFKGDMIRWQQEKAAWEQQAEQLRQEGQWWRGVQNEMAQIDKIAKEEARKQAEAVRAAEEAARAEERQKAIEETKRREEAHRAFMAELERKKQEAEQQAAGELDEAELAEQTVAEEKMKRENQAIGKRLETVSREIDLDQPFDETMAAQVAFLSGKGGGMKITPESIRAELGSNFGNFGKEALLGITASKEKGGRSIAEIADGIADAAGMVDGQPRLDANVVRSELINCIMEGKMATMEALERRVGIGTERAEDRPEYWTPERIAEYEAMQNGNAQPEAVRTEQGTLAERVAEASAEVNTSPTEAQKEAGNYKKGHVRVDGMEISIEQPKGSVRKGVDADGNEWETEMQNTYGYIRGAIGKDGDHIDVFLSDTPELGRVYVVDQVDPRTGEFDEHKVMYGFDSLEEAREAYLSNYEEGWQGLGGITEVNKAAFKVWLQTSKRKTKPFADYKLVTADNAKNERETVPEWLKELDEVPFHAAESADAPAGKVDVAKATEVAKSLGLHVSLMQQDPVDGADAMIDSNGLVKVNFNSPKGAGWLISHESGHRMERLAPEAYKAYKEAALGMMTPEEIQARIDAKREAYREMGLEKSDEQLRGEIVNDMMGDIFAEPGKIDELIKKSNPTVWRGIMNAIEDMWAMLTGKSRDNAYQVYKKLRDALRESRAAYKKEMSDTLERIETKLARLNHSEVVFESSISNDGNLSSGGSHVDDGTRFSSGAQKDGAKIRKDFVNRKDLTEKMARFIKKMSESEEITPENWHNELMHELGFETHEGQNSQYFSFMTPDGRLVSVRMSGHPAQGRNYKKQAGDEHYSIVVQVENWDGRDHMKSSDKIRLHEYHYAFPDKERLVDITKSLFGLVDEGKYADFAWADTQGESPRQGGEPFMFAQISDENYKQIIRQITDSDLHVDEKAAAISRMQQLRMKGEEMVEKTLSADQLHGVELSIREKEEPKKKGIGYKVFYRNPKDGKLYPPMVANPGGADTPVGVWLDADAAPIVGQTKTGRNQVKAGGKGTQGGSGQLAYRPGWHLGEIPYALQFGRLNPETGKKDLFPKDFVWAEVEYAADKDYQDEAYQAGINANGKYQHSLAGLPYLPEDGYYRYRTNPNPETDPWIITGAMKVNRVLSNEEVDDLVRKAGREPQRREGSQPSTAVRDESTVFELNDQQKRALSWGSYHAPSYDEETVELTADNMGEAIYDMNSKYVSEINAARNRAWNLVSRREAYEPVRSLKPSLEDGVGGYLGSRDLERARMDDVLGYDINRNPVTARMMYKEQWKQMEQPLEEQMAFYKRMALHTKNPAVKRMMLDEADYVKNRMEKLKALAEGDEDAVERRGRWSIDARQNGEVRFREYEGENEQLMKASEEHMKAVENGDMETAQKLVDEAAKAAGYTIHAYHGTNRADRVGTEFKPERATSGPMSFFTDNKEIADNYSKNKKDTSMAYDGDWDAGDYHTQFKVNMGGYAGEVRMENAWGYLPFELRNEITKKAMQVTTDDDGNIITKEGNTRGTGGYDWNLKQRRGNAIKALVDEWLESGNLYNKEGKFMEVLEKAGVLEAFEKMGWKDARYLDPNYSEPKTYDTYLKIEKPFDTNVMYTEKFVDRLENWWNRLSKKKQAELTKESMDADHWDKNAKTIEQWVEDARYDLAHGETWAWTVIPDALTEYLKSKGYDGIIDRGGKGGGTGHNVFIPFYPEQIKSAEAVTRDTEGKVIPLSERFDTTQKDIRYKRTYHGSGADFEEFDHSFMGSGEGSQVYGWGTYVSEVDGIARTYADIATAKNGQMRYSYVGEKAMPEWIQNDIIAWMDKYGGYEEAKKAHPYPDKGPAYNETVRALHDSKAEDWQGNRKLYEVEIPDDNGENYIGWEETISSKMQKRIEDALYEECIKQEPEAFETENERKMLKRDIHDAFRYSSLTGKSAYGNIIAFLGTGQKGASKLLSEAGFVGVKVPTNNLREGDKSRNNYVIFEEKDAKIVGKEKFREWDENNDGKVWKVGEKFVSLPSEFEGKTESAQEIFDRQRETMPETAAWSQGMEEVKNNTNAMGLMGKEGSVKRELHRKAKAGDGDAADELVAMVANKAVGEQLKREHPNAVVVYPHAEEASGRNKLPESYAMWLQAMYGFEVNESVVQTDKPHHTGANRLNRFLARARYDGDIEAGREYILVDDVYTMGGTLRDMKDYIESKGGKVVAISTLAFSRQGKRLGITAETKNELLKRGITNEQLKEIGIADNIDGLTELEAREIIVLADSGRDRGSEEGFEGISSQKPRTLPENEGRRQAVRAEAEKIAQSLGKKINVCMSTKDIKDPGVRASIEKAEKEGRTPTRKGWFNTRTGEIEVYAPASADVEDVKKTVLHETVGHYGLRELLSEDEHEYQRAMVEMYRLLNAEQKKQVTDSMQRRGWDVATAMDEFLADVAMQEHVPGWWQKAKSIVKNLLRKVGIDVELSDGDLKYMLWASREALRNSHEVNHEDGSKSRVYDRKTIDQRAADWAMRWHNDVLGLRSRWEAERKASANARGTVAEGAAPEAQRTEQVAARRNWDAEEAQENERRMNQEKSRAFKAWFGDWEKEPDKASKVVDAEGRPLVVYHGTQLMEMYFKEGRPYTNYTERFNTFKDGKGYFTNDRDAAESFARGKQGLYETYLDIKKPFVIDCQGKDWDAIEGYENPDGYKRVSTDYIVNDIKRNHPEYDGVIFKNVMKENNGVVEYPIDDYVPFKAEQIKSAVDNNGEFSRGNKDIRFRDDDDPDDPNTPGGGGSPSPTGGRRRSLEETLAMDAQRFDAELSKMKAEDNAGALAADLRAFVRNRMNALTGERIGANAINSIIAQLDAAKKAKDLEPVLRSIKRTLQEAEVKAEVESMLNALNTRTQSTTPKGIAKGIVVDFGTNKVLEDIRGSYKNMLQTTYDDQITAVNQEMRALKSEYGITRKEEGNAEFLARYEELKAKKDELTAKRNEARNYTAEQEIGALEQRQEEIINEINDYVENGKEIPDGLIQERIALPIRMQLADLRINMKNIEDCNKEINACWEQIVGKRGAERKMILDEIERLHRELDTWQRRVVYDSQRVHEELDDLLKEGKSKRAAFVQKDIERQREVVQEGCNAVRMKPVLEANEGRADTGNEKMDTFLDDLKKTGEELKAMGQDFNSTLYSFNYLLKELDRNHHQGQGPLYDRLMRSKTGAVMADDSYREGVKKFNDTVEAKAKEIFGMSYDDVIEDSKRRTDHKIHIRQMEDNILARRGEMIEVDTTKGEAFYIWLTWRQNQGRVKLENAGYTQETINEIEEMLGEKYLEFGKWATDDFMPQMRAERYNPKYEEIYGTTMHRANHYFPIRIWDKAVHQKGDIGENQSQPMAAATNGRIITRTENRLPIDSSQNAFDVLNRYGQEMEYTYAYADLAKDLNTLYHSNAFKNLIEANYGKQMWKNWVDACNVATETYIGSEPKAIGRWLNKAQGSVAKNGIFMRLYTAIKQITSYPAFFAYSGNTGYWAELVANIGRAFTPWGRFMPEVLRNNYTWAMDHLPAFRHRVEDGNMGIEGLMDDGLFGKFEKKWSKWGMAANKLVDACTVAAGSRAVYNLAYKRAIKNGKSAEEAERIATVEAEICFNESQQSSSPAFSAPVQKDRDLLSRSTVLFQNSNISYRRGQMEGWNDIVRAKYVYNQAINNGQDKKEARKDMLNAMLRGIRKVGIFGVGLPVTWGLASSPALFFAQNEDDEKDDSLKKNMIVNTLMGMLTNGTIVGTWLNAVLSAGDKVLTNGKNWNSKVNYQAVHGFDVLNEIADDMIEAIASDDSAVMWQTLGRTALRMGGINPETFVNIGLGIEDAIRNGGLTAEDVMFILNVPNSQRKKIVERTSRDESLADYLKDVLHSEKSFGKEDIHQMLPSAKETTEKRVNAIVDQYVKVHVPGHAEAVKELVEPIKAVKERYKEIKGIKNFSMRESKDGYAADLLTLSRAIDETFKDDVTMRNKLAAYLLTPAGHDEMKGKNGSTWKKSVMSAAKDEKLKQELKEAVEANDGTKEAAKRIDEAVKELIALRKSVYDMLKRFDKELK